MNHTPKPFEEGSAWAAKVNETAQYTPDRDYLIDGKVRPYAFIVRACNRDHLFDDLVAALQGVLDWAECSECDSLPIFAEARAALPEVQPEVACSAL